MAKTMLKDANLLDVYWKEVVHTSSYILNKLQVKVNNSKTPYKLWYGRTATSRYFKILGSKCYIKRDEQNLRKFDLRNDKGIFLGYLTRRKAYRCNNKRIKKIIKSTNVRVDENWN